MKYEILNKLETYREWPSYNQAKPIELTCAGFEYTGQYDIVKCWSCGLVLSNWIATYDPKQKHRNGAPNCPFVLKFQKAVSNRVGLSISPHLSDDEQRISTDSHSFPKTSINRKSDWQSDDGDDLDMTYLEARLETFKTWVLTFIDRKSMAEAGFFYTGFADRVQCAFCHGILKGWREEDDPMQEHRRHYPNCGFVIGYKKNSEKL